MNSSQEQKSGFMRFKFYRGWSTVYAGTAVLAVLVGSQTGGSIGHFFVAFLKEFGWSRTLLSGAFSLVRIEGSLLGPLEGILTDRLGPHNMVLFGGLFASIGFFLLARVNTPLDFYLALLAITGGVGFGSVIPVTAAVNWWFDRGRTKAISRAMAGVGMGALWSPLIALGLTNFGWRAAAYSMSLTILVFVVPFSRVLRPPQGNGYRNNNSTAIQEKNKIAPELERPRRDFTFTEAIRTRSFWLIPLVHATNGFSASAVYVHGIPHLSDMGFSPEFAGYIFFTYGMVEVMVRMFGGFVGDVFDKRLVIFSYSTVMAGGVVVLAFANSLVLAFLFAILFAIGHGGRGPLLFSIRGEYFGRKNYGKIMGVGSLITGLAGFTTPLMLGALFDVQGSYVLGFIAMAAVTFLGGFLIFWANPPRRLNQKKEVNVVGNS